MAVKTILKLTPTVAVVKISDAGASTISLANDLLFVNNTTGQIDVAATPVVNIRSISYSVMGATAATVVRNGLHVWDLLGVYDLEFNGYSDTQQNTSDIVVTLAGAGQIIFELLKVSGYGDVSTLNSRL